VPHLRSSCSNKPKESLSDFQRRDFSAISACRHLTSPQIIPKK
jgi:hypothetical protein